PKPGPTFFRPTPATSRERPPRAATPARSEPGSGRRPYTRSSPRRRTATTPRFSRGPCCRSTSGASRPSSARCRGWIKPAPSVSSSSRRSPSSRRSRTSWSAGPDGLLKGGPGRPRHRGGWGPADRRDEPARHAADTLSIRRTRFLADGLRERIGVLNAYAHPVDVSVELEFEAAFRDMFAVRAYRDLSLAPLASTRGPREGGLVFERVGRD